MEVICAPQMSSGKGKGEGEKGQGRGQGKPSAIEKAGEEKGGRAP